MSLETSNVGLRNSGSRSGSLDCLSCTLGCSKVQGVKDDKTRLRVEGLGLRVEGLGFRV